MKENKTEIYLRALELEDSTTTIKWRQDKEIWNMVGGARYFVSKYKEKVWVEKTLLNDEVVKLAICIKGSFEIVGIVSLTDFNWINRSAQMHVMVGEKKEWGKGIATMAISQMIEYGFNDKNLNRIYAIILEENIGSVKAFYKNNFLKEGVLRESIFKQGKYHNQNLLSIIKNDYEDLAT